MWGDDKFSRFYNQKSRVAAGSLKESTLDQGGKAQVPPGNHVHLACFALQGGSRPSEAITSWWGGQPALVLPPCKLLLQTCHGEVSVRKHLRVSQLLPHAGFRLKVDTLNDVQHISSSPLSQDVPLWHLPAADPASPQGLWHIRQLTRGLGRTVCTRHAVSLDAEAASADKCPAPPQGLSSLWLGRGPPEAQVRTGNLVSGRNVFPGHHVHRNVDVGAGAPQNGHGVGATVVVHQREEGKEGDRTCLVQGIQGLGVRVSDTIQPYPQCTSAIGAATTNMPMDDVQCEL